MKSLFAIVLIFPLTGRAALLPPPQSVIDAVDASISNMCNSGTSQVCLKEQLCTNQAPWTWPLQLSFIGTDIPGGYSHALIAPNFVVANGHYGAELWTNTTTFRYNDTNGVQHDVHFFRDEHCHRRHGCLCQLSSNVTCGVTSSLHLPTGLYELFLRATVPPTFRCFGFIPTRARWIVAH